MTSSEIEQGGAVAEGDRAKKRGWISRIILFIQQVIGELKKVVTPTRSEWINYTLVAIAFVIIMMALVWVLDQAFGWLTVFVFGTPIV